MKYKIDLTCLYKQSVVFAAAALFYMQIIYSYFLRLDIKIIIDKLYWTIH